MRVDVFIEADAAIGDIDRMIESVSGSAWDEIAELQIEEDVKSAVIAQINEAISNSPMSGLRIANDGHWIIGDYESENLESYGGSLNSALREIIDDVNVSISIIETIDANTKS